MSKGFASNYRIVILAFGVLVCFGGIATRLVYLHIIDRAKLVNYVEKARRQVNIEYARRGDILDTKGDVLATSRSLVMLGVDPQMLRPEDEKKWPELARLVGLSLDDLKVVLTKKTRAAAAASAETAPATGEATEEERDIRWAKLNEGLSEATYDKITALGVHGVYGIRNYRRAYPHNQLAAHILGYVNKAEVPAAGVERYADFYLRGQNGWRESEKDGHQRELAQFRSRDVPATDGYTVVLSIDSVIQHLVEAELEAIAKEFTPKKATVIVSDARSGFLLALGNYPSFNPNEYNTAPLEAQTNPAIAFQLDPGSTFKIVAVSGALNDGLATLDTRFDCSQEIIEYNGRRLRLMKDDHRVDHPLAVSEIVALSSNRGATQLAMKLGDQRFYDYARAFGFGERSGFPFGGEISGLLNPPEKWSGIDITRIPTGYSISATPIQIHYGMATIASGGELLRPQLIREVRDALGEPVYRFTCSSRRRVITAKTAEQVALALRGVVTDGTGKNAAIPGYQVAGKTGTAQKLIDGKYSEHNHVGSFVGFFPASRPRVVMTIIVDDGHVPNGGEAYGAAVAAPSFKRLGEKLIHYLNIEPVETVTEPKKPLFAMEGPHP